MSVCMHSGNQKCNAYQVVNGLFLASLNAPDRLIEWAARSGVCLSSGSVLNTVNSLAEKAEADLKTL
ncbi:hypothetical protein SISSUDRAFT_995570, partial [Sistotremastrum suecicum HHB10207 ss-3]